MLTKALWGFALVGLFCTSCVARELTDAEKQIITRAITKDFKDPSSAQFRWQPVPGDKVATGQFYCAMVNAKKSYGAYVGFTPFAVMFASKDGTVGLALVAGGIPSPGTPQETFIYNLCKEHSLKAE